MKQSKVSDERLNRALSVPLLIGEVYESSLMDGDDAFVLYSLCMLCYYYHDINLLRAGRDTVVPC